MIREIKYFVLYLIVFLPTCLISSAQRKLALEPDNWATELSKCRLTEVNSMGKLSELLMQTDSTRALPFLDSVESSDNAKGYYFRAHFCMTKAKYIYDKFGGYDKYKDRRSKELKPIKDQMMKLYADAIDAAYHTGDERTIGWACFYSAILMRHFGETGWAVMYSKNGVDLFEKVGYDVEHTVYIVLAELLYEVREYEESLSYAKKGLAAWGKNKDELGDEDLHRYRIRNFIIIGLNYYKKNNQDSAIAYYRRALQLATEKKDSLWTGEVLGHIGRTLYSQNKFDSAWLLFKTDYQNSKAGSVYDNAANASEWAARANLARGNKATALEEARQAIRLLGLWPNGPYLRDTYYILMQIFRASGNYDSAFYYNDRYASLNDSLEKEVATSSLAISNSKLNDAVSRFNIQKINEEKNTQILVRNIIIAAIIVFSFLILLIFNRNRLKTKMKMERIEKEKNLMEEEIASAQAQLKMFTENIIEKTNLIEKLEQELKGREDSAEHQTIIAELSQRTILTEEDWLTFKTLFEKTNPDFFTKLKKQANDITLAEQRMAALTRLKLTNKQMAAILGISSNSVIKAKQRLRHRFNFPTDFQMEEFISNW